MKNVASGTSGISAEREAESLWYFEEQADNQIFKIQRGHCKISIIQTTCISHYKVYLLQHVILSTVFRSIALRKYCSNVVESTVKQSIKTSTIVMFSFRFIISPKKERWLTALRNHSFTSAKLFRICVDIAIWQRSWDQSILRTPFAGFHDLIDVSYNWSSGWRAMCFCPTVRKCRINWMNSSTKCDKDVRRIDTKRIGYSTISQ